LTDTRRADAIRRKYPGAANDCLATAGDAQHFGTLAQPAHVARLAAPKPGPAFGVTTGSIVAIDQTVTGACPA